MIYPYIETDKWYMEVIYGPWAEYAWYKNDWDPGDPLGSSRDLHVAIMDACEECGSPTWVRRVCWKRPDLTLGVSG